MRNFIAVTIVLILLGGGYYFFLASRDAGPAAETVSENADATLEPILEGKWRSDEYPAYILEFKGAREECPRVSSLQSDPWSSGCNAFEIRDGEFIGAGTWDLMTAEEARHLKGGTQEEEFMQLYLALYLKDDGIPNPFFPDGDGPSFSDLQSLTSERMVLNGNSFTRIQPAAD